MSRILTRKWFWILLTSVGPVLWGVLATSPEETARSQAATAAQIKAVAAVCEKLGQRPCGH